MKTKQICEVSQRHGFSSGRMISHSNSMYCRRHGAAMSTPLYGHLLRPLDRLHFTIHRDHEAIHVRKAGQLIGLIWPAFIGAPEVVGSARQRLGLNSATDSVRRKP